MSAQIARAWRLRGEGANPRNLIQVILAEGIEAKYFRDPVVQCTA